jgi:hypothetical protein
MIPDGKLDVAVCPFLAEKIELCLKDNEPFDECVARGTELNWVAALYVHELTVLVQDAQNLAVAKSEEAERRLSEDRQRTTD